MNLDDKASYLSKALRKGLLLKEQKKYGASLIDFAGYVWPVVEPAIPFVKGYVLQAMADHLQAVTDGYIRRLLINVPPGFTKSLMTDVFWPAWEWGPKDMPWMRYMCAAYSNHLTERDNMRCRNVVISDRYKRLWGERFKISNEQFTKIKFANDQTGWKLATSVSGIGTGERADRVIIDDPNNPQQMESEVVRDSINMWFTEIIPDRLNNQAESAIVVIQQRTHEDDVSGTAIAREMGYTHLCVPMYYVPSHHVNGFTLDEGKAVIKSFIGPEEVASVPEEQIFWKDKRSIDGELAWPERFSEKICQELERDKGPYAWCSTAEAPILMADLSLKPISEIVRGDQIVGFTIGNASRRARLRPTEVLSISASRRPIVKMTLSSGEVIRCTPDHKWWTGRNDKSHKPYAPANVGSVLSRVCPPRLPQLADDDFRLAGWLGGFFDGEGTVSINKRREGEGTPVLGFSQGTGRNGPLCDKLEFILDRFGFNWGSWDKPAARKDAEHKIRFYWLKMAAEGRASRLPLYQRFLHIAKPVKWRDRIIEAATNARLYTGSEKVISIHDDGIESVYGLETTTGNYVVWGLASSNSGQYMQDPEPRGGSIIKRDFWQVWQEDKYPPLEYILASLDTAYTAKEENDASALTVWGVFREDPNKIEFGTEALWQPRDTPQIVRGIQGNPRLILMHAWQERLEFDELVQRVLETCILDPGGARGRPRFAVDKLLIESKASGMSVGQELHRMLRGTGKMGVELINPTQYGDKIARVHAVQHLFADGMIYAPDKAWADMVINQCAVFPRGSRDDLVDSTSQAIRYLRDCGFALKRSEYAVEVEDDLRYRSPSDSMPLYPV